MLIRSSLCFGIPLPVAGGSKRRKKVRGSIHNRSRTCRTGPSRNESPSGVGRPQIALSLISVFACLPTRAFFNCIIGLYQCVDFNRDFLETHVLHFRGGSTACLDAIMEDLDCMGCVHSGRCPPSIPSHPPVSLAIHTLDGETTGSCIARVRCSPMFRASQLQLAT